MESVRIQKYLAECGICSRRQAERWITEGVITVNDNLAALGQKINPRQDRLKIRGRSIGTSPTRKITLVMNKPKGVICTNSDPYHDTTVFDLLPPPYRSLKLFCAGRLDKESEGLLILTNDGALSQKITHPSHEMIKRYYVTLNNPFDTEKIPELIKGIKDDGERLYAKKIIPDSRGTDKEKRLEVHMAQGHKREIRRLFYAVGYRVKKLRRFQLGRFRLKNLSPGEAKPLKAQEIRLLLKN